MSYEGFGLTGGAKSAGIGMKNRGFAGAFSRACPIAAEVAMGYGLCAQTSSGRYPRGALRAVSGRLGGRSFFSARAAGFLLSWRRLCFLVLFSLAYLLLGKTPIYDQNFRRLRSEVKSLGFSNKPAGFFIGPSPERLIPAPTRPRGRPPLPAGSRPAVPPA